MCFHCWKNGCVGEKSSNHHHLVGDLSYEYDEAVAVTNHHDGVADNEEDDVKEGDDEEGKDHHYDLTYAEEVEQGKFQSCV